MSPTAKLNVLPEGIFQNGAQIESAQSTVEEGLGRLMKQELGFSEEVTEICRNKTEETTQGENLKICISKTQTRRKFSQHTYLTKDSYQGYVYNQFKSIIKKKMKQLEMGGGLTQKNTYQRLIIMKK